MTALTVPTRRRFLFAAFRGGVDGHVVSTEAPVATVIENESEIAPAPAVDSLEPPIEAAETAASVASANDLGVVQGPAESARGLADPARGGVFAGTKAQIRLTPSKAPTHPTSGRRGDLFVDSAGRLWFCRSGGKAATWKQVKLV